MASKKRKLIEGLIPPKPKKKYDVTETKPGDKPWWVKEGLGRKPPNPLILSNHVNLRCLM